MRPTSLATAAAIREYDDDNDLQAGVVFHTQTLAG